MWFARRAVLTLTVALGAGQAHPDTLDAPSQLLKVSKARLASSRVCGPTDGLARLDLTFEAVLLDLSPKAVLASRRPSVSPVGLAESVAAGRAGRFIFDFGGLEIYTDPPPRPKVDDFVVLAPGHEYTVRVETGVFVAARGSPAANISSFAAEGSAYALQLALRMWPYRPPDKLAIETFRREWRATGELVVGTVLTDFLEFEVPSLDEGVPCK